MKYSYRIREKDGMYRAEVRPWWLPFFIVLGECYTLSFARNVVWIHQDDRSKKKEKWKIVEKL